MCPSGNGKKCLAPRLRLQYACGNIPHYSKFSHSVYGLKFHMLSITKHRKPVLHREMAIRVRELTGNSCKGMDILRSSEATSPKTSCISSYSTSHLSVSKLLQRLKGKDLPKLLDKYKKLAG